tara:strand:- start:2260 stop:3360 length:1101 start_codon:yes stop_codon:yes gene_type:complete
MDDDDKYLRCELCQYFTNDLKDFRKHCNTNKHFFRKIGEKNEKNEKKVEKNEKKVKKNEKKSTKIGKNRPKSTKIGKNRPKMTKSISKKKRDSTVFSVQKNQSDEKINKCCNCGKVYKYKSGLSRHKNKCKKVINNVDIITKHEDKDDDNLEKINKLCSIILSQNENFLEQQKIMVKTHELLEKSLETTNSMVPKIGNNNNNQISINVFLNEHCKNAMNLTDFMSNLNVSNEDLQYTKEYGYIEGVSNIFKNRLKNMKPTERPIHCSDIEKLQFYIKDNNKWDKDEYNKKIDVSIENLKQKQIKQLSQWEKENPNYLKDDKLTQEWKLMLFEILGKTNKEGIDTTNEIIKQNLANELCVNNIVNIK